jgi:hypothetical protein
MWTSTKQISNEAETKWNKEEWFVFEEIVAQINV